MEKTQKKIPTLEELKSGNVEQDELRKLLESEPPVEWLKKGVNAKTGKEFTYLPIERVDFLLRSVFGSHWWEVLSVGIYQHSVQVSGRLFYINPITGRVEHTDGVGGSSSAEGMDVAAPKAESNAKKSAAKKLGKLFGRDLSRIDEVEPAKEEEVKEEGSEIYLSLADRLRKADTKFKSNQVKKAIQTRVEEGDLEEFEIDKLMEIAKGMTLKKPATHKKITKK